MLIVARTDAVAIEGFERGLERAERYLEAGADVIFIEAMASVEQMRVANARFAGRAPLLANMVEGGSTPLSSAAELEAMGFGVAIFPGAVVRALAKTLQDFYGSLKAHGTTEPFLPRMFDFKGLNGLLGTDGILEAGRGYEARD
jgi:2-methylisocitrate lyase-like PEP mutase family enzyme